MIKETTPNSDYIKAIAGKFDLDTVFTLILNEKSIVKLASIIQCRNLEVLNLSRNKIILLTGIEGLTDLKVLDLSYNKIKNIDNLKSLSKLRNLSLQGNFIEKINNLEVFLKQLTCLERLYLQEMSGREANPICKIENYRDTFFGYCIKLKILDGSSKEVDFLSSMKGMDSNIDSNNIDFEDIKFDFKSSINTNALKLIQDSNFYQDIKEYDKNYVKVKKEIELDNKNFK